MKRFYQAAIMMAMAVLSFTSCEDVPEPYHFTYKPSESTNENVAPQGDGASDATAYNVAAALDLTSNGTYTSNKVYIKGVINQIDNIDTGSYGNATYSIADKKGNSVQLKIYRGYALGNQHFTSSDAIKVGDEVVIYGELTLFGTTQEVKQGNYIVSQNGQTSGASTPSTPATPSQGLNISGTTVTLTNSNATAGTTTTSVDLNTLGLANNAEVTTITFPDGATATFDSNGNTHKPIFSSLTSGIRTYANCKITINGKAKIAKVTFDCDSYNGTDYVGNTTATVTFSGNDAVYTNVFTGSTGGGVQLRVKKITITYAQ